MATHQPIQRIHTGFLGTRRHLVVALLIVGLPAVFLIATSRVAGIALRDLLLDVLVSSWRLLIAYLIAAALGWLSAVVFYRGRRSDIALPLFDVLQSFPTFALLPIVQLTWGASGITVIAALVVTVIWPIFFSVVSALKHHQHDWEEAVRIAGLRGIQYLRYFIWPISARGLVTGSIIGIGEGWEALVATEMIVKNPKGLGQFFLANTSSPLTTTLGILALLAIIFSVNKILWLPLLDWSHRAMET